MATSPNFTRLICSLIWNNRLIQSVVNRSGANRIVLLSFFLAALAIEPSSLPAGAQEDDCNIDQIRNCPANRIDLAFILDRSGSMAFRIDPPSPGTSSPGRGQTYNMQIEGVLRALDDPTIIPRDGSIAVTVVVFAEVASVRVQRKVVNTAEDACMIKSAVEALKCDELTSLQEPCPSGGTFVSNAIDAANDEMDKVDGNRNRRVFLLSTDGEFNDFDRALITASRVDDRMKARGIDAELDVILIGISNPGELAKSKKDGDRLVFPQPADDLPGRTLIIPVNGCNEPGQREFDECNRQADEFAQLTQVILRSNISKQSITVTTDADTSPNTPSLSNEASSLRQAIEAANCRGGATTITFSNELKGKTIRPDIPLPALTAPNIIMDGCVGTDCSESITVDGSRIGAAESPGSRDGIVIRSNQAVVRNMKITNFQRAGIAIIPVCASDAVGRNVVKGNTLSGNKIAGVLVLDPPSAVACPLNNAPDSGAGFEGVNVGNMILQNAISGSATLIDLGGDGATPNDSGDADVGPNTLLNFPDALRVTKTSDGNSITGQVTNPIRANATVEIFAVTSARALPAGPVIEGVVYLASAVTDKNGEFRVGGVRSSPTGIYTATVTDQRGNTSELMPGTRAAFPAATITEFVDFGEVNLNSTPARQVSVTNIGNAPLVIRGCAIQKCDPADNDNVARFNNTDCPDESTLINPGARVIINVTFTALQCGEARACLFVTSNSADGIQLRTILTGRGGEKPRGEVIIGNGNRSLKFEPVAASGSPRKNEIPSSCFMIKNTGCALLNLTLDSIERTGKDVKSRRISNPDDSRLFTLKVIRDGVSEAVRVGSPIPRAIDPNDTVSFCVEFNPVAPAIAGKTCGATTTGLSADQVLPDTVTSTIKFTQPEGGTIKVKIVGKVNRLVKLIDPCAPLSKDPVIIFTRSGDILTVTFYVFDPGQDINRVTYRFLDTSGKEVPVDVPTTDLNAFKTQFVRGQSFGIIQDFSRANKHPNVSVVEVTVFDSANKADTWKSRPLGSAIRIAKPLQHTDIATVIMPAIRLDTSAPGRKARKRRLRLLQ